MTLKKYYSSFKSSSGALAGLFTALPFLSAFLPGGAYLFPPLGDLATSGRAGLVILAFAVTYAAYFIVKSKPIPAARMISVGVVLATIGLLAYLGLFERFVRRVDIPSRNTAVYVTVGGQRTAFAISNFGSASDEELLRARGTDEEQLRLLWTTGSLVLARLAIFAAYSLTLLALVGMFSLGIASEVSNPRT